VNLFGLMEASGSAMQAERMRAEVVAANMANAESTRAGSGGGAYRRQHVVFEANSADSAFMNSFADLSNPTATMRARSSSMGRMNSEDTMDAGVHIAQVIEDSSPPLKRYDPGHPDAGPDGYVAYPDINPLTEMVDLMGATRAYGLNSSAVQAEKSMIVAALEIVKS
jgi:flagellar basal-body rod protein FlgC